MNDDGARKRSAFSNGAQQNQAVGTGDIKQQQKLTFGCHPRWERRAEAW